MKLRLLYGIFDPDNRDIEARIFRAVHHTMVAAGIASSEVRERPAVAMPISLPSESTTAAGARDRLQGEACRQLPHQKIAAVLRRNVWQKALEIRCSHGVIVR